MLVRPGKPYTSKNREAVAVIKAQIITENPNINNVQAGLQAVRRYDMIRKSPNKQNVSVVVVAKQPGPAGSPLILIKGSSPTRRVRLKQKLLSSYTKDDLIRIFKAKGIVMPSSYTKANIIKRVQHRAVSPILKAPATKEISRGNKLLKEAKKFTSLKYKTKKNIQNYANRHKIPNVSTKLLKAEMIDKIYAKLGKNAREILKKSNKNSVTMRIVIDKLIRDHGWNAAKNIDRKFIMNIFTKEFYKRT
jgi:hypothetical protein